VEIPQLSITAIAVDKISEFIGERQPPPLGVRIFVYSDGSGGINHSMSFVDGVDSSDSMFSIAGITFITDASSAMFLNNMTLDFVEVDGVHGFVFNSDCVGKNCFNCRGACRGCT
jgi:iron-sulfur cluster assembly accessory protein